MINSKTKILGIFGYPIGHSLSPLMHNSVIKKMGLDYAYLPFEVRPENLESALNSIQALGIAGVNVTIPHKEKVIKHLCAISDEAMKIGAVNTIVNKDGCLTGYNTDYYGFLRSISERINLKSKNVLMLGCGGVSKAIAFALFRLGVKKLILSDIDSKKAKNFLKSELPVSKIEIIQAKKISEFIKGADVFINATPVGMKKNDPSPLDKKLLRENIFVYDAPGSKELHTLSFARRVRVAVRMGVCF